MSIFRRTSLPDDVAGALPAGERVLAFAAYDAGHLVATMTGLWECPREVAAVLWHWDEIDRAEWAEGHLAMQVTPDGSDPRPVSFTTTAPGKLPEVIRDRVNASIVINDWHRLASGGGVRVLARRRQGEERLRWLLAFDRESDAADASSRAEAAARLRLARESVGESPAE